MLSDRNAMKKTVLSILFIVFTFCILKYPKISLYYALTGIDLWYQKMLPTLVPFMILSGILIRLNLSDIIGRLFSRIPFALFSVSKNAVYVICIGFLCGFPMGAKLVADLYLRKKISKAEGEYLLSFCNNIGPVYFVSYVLPLIQRKMLLPYLFGMYGLPLIYGWFLRYTTYRKYDLKKDSIRLLSEGQSKIYSIPEAVDESIRASMISIYMLCGYMILFNLCNLIPHLMFGGFTVYLAPFFEISSGIAFLRDKCPIYTLLLLPFGGLSCLAQTYSCIRDTGFQITRYLGHKIVLTILTGIYYLGWFFLFPASFLR